MSHANTALKKQSSPEKREMVGEILHDRYAVLEQVGKDRYVVFDMRAMRKMKILLKPGGGFLVWRPAEAPPPTPPPLPPDALKPCPTAKPAPPPLAPIPSPPVPTPAPLPALGLESSSLEEAWFAHGDQQEREESVEEVEDYDEYNRLLADLALQLA